MTRTIDGGSHQVKRDRIDVDATIKKVERLLEAEQGLSPALKSAIELLLVIVALLAHRLNLNSHNSSKPPSSDPNRKRPPKGKENKRPGDCTHALGNAHHLRELERALEQDGQAPG